MTRLWTATALIAATVLATTLNVAAAEPTAKQDFDQYCSPCHGADGKGHGKLLYTIPNVNPPDLTQLSKKNGGNFPTEDVARAIDGRAGIPSHKRFDMPFFGVQFQKQGQEFSEESNASVARRVSNLVKYIEGIQQK